MGEGQFDTYAKFYNLLYKEKDYAKEAEYINFLVSKFSSKPKEALHLLDMACGTGRHLLELSNMGYVYLSGSDIAAAMIQEARYNTARANRKIEYYNYSFQEADKVPGKYDVITSMFSAVNYIVGFEDQLQSFRNINNLLKPGGQFIFDYWNGNAVVRDYSPVKVLRRRHEDAEIIRISETSLDLLRQHATVTFNCLYLEGDQKVDEFQEVHHLHYYYFSEMEHLLKITGFDILHRSCFLKPDQSPDPYDWNINIVAQKRK